MWNSKSFFLNEKARQNIIHCRTIKITLFSSFNGLPLLWGSSPKFFTWPPVPASTLSTIQASSHFAPTVPDLSAPSSSLLLSRLSQIHSFGFHWYYTFPGNVCFSSWAHVPVSLVSDTRQGLNANLLPAWTNEEGLPRGDALLDGGHFYHFLGLISFSPKSPASLLQKWKGQTNLVWDSRRFSHSLSTSSTYSGAPELRAPA